MTCWGVPLLRVAQPGLAGRVGDWAAGCRGWGKGSRPGRTGGRGPFCPAGGRWAGRSSRWSSAPGPRQASTPGHPHSGQRSAAAALRGYGSELAVAGSPRPRERGRCGSVRRRGRPGSPAVGSGPARPPLGPGSRPSPRLAAAGCGPGLAWCRAQCEFWARPLRVG